MAKREDERVRLFAAYLNTIGAGLIVTGVVAPIAATIVNPTLSTASFLYFGFGCFALSVVLHGLAQASLGRLPNDE